MIPQSTHFAPAERATKETIQRQAALFAGSSTAQALDAVNDMVLILNTQRQAVFANKAILAVTGHDSRETLLGLRPGNIMDCMHNEEEPDGCGTTTACVFCGAVQTIIAGFEGKPVIKECRLVRSIEGHLTDLDLRIKGTPISVDGEPFLVLAVQDIGHETRRRVLERTFFHDILNIAGGLRGIAQYVNESAPDHLREETSVLADSFETMVDELLGMRTLLAAENKELVVRPLTFSLQSFLSDLVHIYSRHPTAQGKVLNLTPGQDCDLNSDPGILKRVLGNMIKNGLEASAEGDTVQVGHEQAPDAIRIWVRNTGVLSKQARVSLFQRSFSTKGPGRGLGAYSMRLFTEEYLQGSIDFVSSPEKGTIFTVTLPLALE